MPSEPLRVGYGAVAALVVVIVASVWLGARAQQAVKRGEFLKGFFLGNRGLGVWTMALTATVQSGGTFMGFPSLVYTHGWVVALWIGSYMLVPLTGFAVLGKRLAQLSRRTGAITVPDLFRGRFASPAAGLTSSLLIMFFLTFMMVAQFKAGMIVMKVSWPGSGALALAETSAAGPGWYDYLGLGIFTVTVVGYTLIGGFLASVWTDLFQSVLMFIGVLVLLVLVFREPAVGGLEQATLQAVANTDPSYVFAPGYGRTFLPLGLACSMFVTWIFGGIASPASVVRVMAAKDTSTLRRSIVVLGTYNFFIYPPLIAICIAARAVMPELAALGKSDEVIPRMALWTTRDLPLGSLVAGMILAAPFGAIMATVSSYLVVISSGVVRDIYQQFVHRSANEMEIRRMTTLVMIVIGSIGVLANLRPVTFLQALVVFCTSGGAASFLVPAVMACFWRRANAQGAVAAMLSGGGTVGILYVVGLLVPDSGIGPATAFRPYYALTLEPVVWGILVSALVGSTVTLLTRPPDPRLVARMFDPDPAVSPAASPG